jgi:hypothetical protein
MTWKLKRELLTVLYEVYEQEASKFQNACELGCSTCCSSDLVCTGLEANHILISATGPISDYNLKNISDWAHEQRILRPTLTTNELAELCLQRIEPNLEARDTRPGPPCPFRTDQGCPLYQWRPLACRIMWSKDPCHKTGEAEMDPLLISLGTAFQQILEDIDFQGLYGNLFDLLDLFSNESIADDYMAGKAPRATGRLRATKANPGLMVPKEHRPYVAKALGRLWMRRAHGMMFKEAAASLKG